MKKLLIALVLAASLAVPSFADFNINFSGGDTTLGMKSFNNNLSNFGTAMDNFYVLSYAGTVNNTTMSNAFYGAVDMSFSLSPNFMLGPRVEYITAMEGQMQYLGTDAAGDNLNFTDNVGGSLVPIMLGISYKSGFESIPLSIKGGIYGGYALASAYDDITMSETIAGAPSSATQIFVTQGSCVVFEVLLSADWSFGSLFSLGLNLGYRKADVTKMTYVQSCTNSLTGITVAQGDTAKDVITGNALDYDFSGLIGGLAFNFTF